MVETSPEASSSVDEELALLLEVLPPPLWAAASSLPAPSLLEIVMDLGRLPEARLVDGPVRLADTPVTRDDLDAVLARLGPMSSDNRAGIERTLHRVSGIKNRKGEVVGLTLRVGRAIFGTIDMLRDLIETGQSVLLLGRPGVGKTTKLREVARVLADDFNKRVVIVDTSNEIGGDGDVPHPGIGSARRMQVAVPEQQHAVMIEAVENHMPEVVIVDEIGTAAEAAAARTIAERGVQLIATAHGNTLDNLVQNPTLSDLVGGVHTVTLSDEEARRRRTQKTINERRSPPTFDIVVEIIDRDEVTVHSDTGAAVDRLLAGAPAGGERRHIVDGEVQSESPTLVGEAQFREIEGTEAPLRIHAHAVSEELLARVLREIPHDVHIVAHPEDADLIVTLRSRAGDPRVRRAARKNIPVQTVKRNSSAEMRRALQRLFAAGSELGQADAKDAVLEAEHAIGRVMRDGVAVALAPRPSELRKLQHRVANRHQLTSTSFGPPPLRHVVIYPP